MAIQSNDSLSNIQSIFVQDENGVVDYCKTYPLKSSSRKGDIGTKCSLSHFDLSSTPNQCNAQILDIVYEEFVMETTIVTEFNLFCNEDYKVYFCIPFKN